MTRSKGCGTLYTGSCSINLANSSLLPVTGSPDALVLSLAITFAEQNLAAADFIGTHEVYSSGTSLENTSTGEVDLGALVVSQGQDFTLSVSPGGGNSITVPANGTANLVLTTTGLNGFNGSITLYEVQSGDPCFLLYMPTTMQANAQATLTISNRSCPTGAIGVFTFSGKAASISPSPVTRIAYSTPVLMAGPGGDFTITVGTPSASWLSATGSVNYLVTVQSVNAQSGTVNLSLSGLPAGVSGYFYQPQLSLSARGSVSTTLVLNGSANTPGGTYPLTVTGIMGSNSHTPAFSLGTQVTTFQVTSVIGSAVVHNNGQEVQATMNVPAGNAPVYTTCSSPDPNVSRRVISSTAATVTLGITASTSAMHGTRTLSLNGGAAKVHAAVADYLAVGSLSQLHIPAGATTIEYLPGDFYGACDYYCVPPRVWVEGPTHFPAWGDITIGSMASMTLYLAPQVTDSGQYFLNVDFCSANWNGLDPSDPFSCEVPPIPFFVDPAPPPPPPPPPTLSLSGPQAVPLNGTNKFTVSMSSSGTSQTVQLSLSTDSGTTGSAQF